MTSALFNTIGECCILEPKQLPKVAFDLLIVTGNTNDIHAAIKEISSYGINSEKVVIDRAMLFPGFTVERYNALRGLSILSIDCFAGILYNALGLPFLSPTINMFFSENDFLKFLSAPQDYMRKDLVFKGFESEPYPSQNVNYPVFAIDDILLHMNHYGKLGPEIAAQKWIERKKRINWDNLCVFMKTQDRNILERFQALPHRKKICLTTIKSDYPCAYYVPHDYFMGQPFWKVMTQVATGYLYKYDIWDFLINGRKTEQDIPIWPTSFKRDRRKIMDNRFDVGILGFYNNECELENLGNLNENWQSSVLR